MEPSAFDPGTIIGGRFEVDVPLGEGALGQLYRATDQQGGNQVALRILTTEISRSEVLIDGLRTRVRVASQLTHKNVARLYGFGRHGSQRYIASEYVSGQSLREMIRRKTRAGKTFSLKGTYNVVAHICNALQAAHELTPTLAHTMVGPSAVRVNETGRIKVCDFGIVSALPEGSPIVERFYDAYCMAPEAYASPQDAGVAADVFSLGVLIYELLTGQPPAPSIEPIGSFVAGIPVRMDGLVHDCLHPDPERRPHAVRDVKVRLYECLEAEETAVGGTDRPVAGYGASPQYGGNRDLSEAADDDAMARVDRGPVSPSTVHNLAPPVPIDEVVQSVAAPPQSPMAHVDVGAAAAIPPLKAAPSQAAAAPPIQAPLPRSMPQPVQQPARIEDLLGEEGEAETRWLIRKGGLDFGPFSMGDVKQQLYKGEFTPDSEIIDNDTGQRCTLRKHPRLERFCIVLEQHHKTEAIRRQQADETRRASRRRAIAVTVIAVLVVGLAAAAVVLFYPHDPQEKVRVVYRERPQEDQPEFRIVWQKEPAEQAKRRRRLRRKKTKRSRASASAGRKTQDDVTYLGDATERGGDQLLSQQQIQAVMQKHVQQLAPCVIAEARRQPSLRRVSIDFGVKGSGGVSYVKVNGESDGVFQACVARRMMKVKFPKYDGSLTRASFAMNLKY